MAKGNSSSVPHTRRVAVALIISTSSLSDEPSFLLVPSRKHTGKFVFPKGGVEEGESAAVAGERESWEEGGLILGSATHLSHLIELPDKEAHKSSPSQDRTDPTFVPITTYSFEIYSLPGVPKLAEDWPERVERGPPKWVTGWSALEDAVRWGRRQEVMLEAVQLAKSRLS